MTFHSVFRNCRWSHLIPEPASGWGDRWQAPVGTAILLLEGGRVILCMASFGPPPALGLMSHWGPCA